MGVRKQKRVYPEIVTFDLDQNSVNESPKSIEESDIVLHTRAGSDSPQKDICDKIYSRCKEPGAYDKYHQSLVSNKI